MVPIFGPFPAERSGGRRLHRFHLCQLQRARGQGEGDMWNLWEQGKEDAALCISALAGSCGQANDANPQPRGSLICFGVPKFSLGNPSSVLGCQTHLCSTECGSFLVEPAEEREW